MVNCFVKYGLLHLIQQVIANGIYMSVAEGKMLIKNAVRERDNARFLMTCTMYKSLSLYTQCIKSIQMWNWWHLAQIDPLYARKCQVLARILFSETCFSDNTWRFKSSNGSALCNLCSQYCEETAHHVLFECENGSALRDQCLSLVKEEAPPQLWNEFVNGDKIVMLVSCFNSLPILEWLSFYDSILDFVNIMYRNRREEKLKLY